MTTILTDNAHYSAIATAIRSKNGLSASYTPSEMAAAITAIPSGSSAVLGSKSITENGTYYASADSLDGYSMVDVNVAGAGGNQAAQLLAGTLSSFFDNTVSNVRTSAAAWNSGIQSIEMTAVEEIATQAFYYCSNLSYASFPACISIGVGAFSACSNLQSVTITSCGRMYSNAFKACSKLPSIHAPVCSSIGSNAFADCHMLTEAVFPQCTTMGSFVFASCLSLPIISLPLCVHTDTNAFMDCIRMHTAWLPALSSIAYQVFRGCSRLMSLYLLSTAFVPVYNADQNFDLTPMSKSSYTGSFGSIFVRESLYSDFVAASVWSKYSARIVSLTDAEIEALPFS